MRVSIDGGEPMQMTNGKASWPAVSPDGRFIAFGTDEESDENPNQVIKVIPFEGGEPIKSFELPVSGIWYNRLRWSPDGKAIIYKDEVQGLWRQNLNSDKTERMEGLDDLRIIHLAVSNKELIYSGGIPMREIVILENFH
jgi:Tol biopolymer transport system component